MRVLYLNPFSQEVSGPDESLRTLLGALIPMGVEAHLVLPRPGPQGPRYEALGVRVHYAPLTILKRRPGPAAALLPVQVARGTAAIMRIARRERIALIHTNMEVVLDGALASRFLGIPHVLHYRGNTKDDPKVVFDALTRFWTGTAEKVFCISNATAAIFRRRNLGAKVESLYNPVDLDAFFRAPRSEQVRRELGAAATGFLVGTVGRIHPRKDVETFIRVAALVANDRTDARFVIVGTAEAPEEVAYEAKLRALATQLGLDDRLVWAGARRDIPAVMKAIDVLLVCSRHEGFGRVVAEAIAAGTPVIASRDGAFPELLEAGGGVTVQPGDPSAFARATIDVQRSPPPRQMVDRFSSGAIAHVVFNVYSSLVATPRGPKRPHA